ncbi:MAG: monovalent cation/H+ antiporter subunit D [Chromatiaceae bacterium]|nr:monovalent cation/H+ antiporter subunit D [Chromatiaceae bacterium]
MSHLVILPVLIPLAAGALLLLAGSLGQTTQRTVSVVATAALLPVALLLLGGASSGLPQVYYLGDWPAPYGIVLVADRLSALMLTLCAVLALAALLYALDGDDQRGRHFHALFQMQLLGVNGAFLTGDLFNLFVFFEILLIASYSLQLYGGGATRVRAGMHVLVLNLVGSSVFLIGIAAVYAATGTLNMADLAIRVAAAGPEQAGLLRTGGLLLLVVFALKAALVPLGFWLSPAYSAACAPVAALFAIMTKVGVYAILRIHGLVFGPGAGHAASLADPWLIPIGLATVAVATLGVLASRDLKRLLAFLVVLSAGTLTAALGLASQAAVSAALYYILNSTLVGGGLFLLADLVARQRGNAGAALDREQSVIQTELLGTFFFIGAIGIAGLPPLAGFAAKVYILESALSHPAAYWMLGLILGTGLLAIVALSRAGSAIFWRTGEAPPAGERAGVLALSSTGALILGAAFLMLIAGSVTDFTRATAAQLADPAIYIDSVMANEGVSIPARKRGTYQ